MASSSVVLVAPSPVLALPLPARALKRQVSAMPFGEICPVTPVLVTIPPVMITMRAIVEPELDALCRSRCRHKHDSPEGGD